MIVPLGRLEGDRVIVGQFTSLTVYPWLPAQLLESVAVIVKVALPALPLVLGPWPQKPQSSGRSRPATSAAPGIHYVAVLRSPRAAAFATQCIKRIGFPAPGSLMKDSRG